MPTLFRNPIIVAQIDAPSFSLDSRAEIRKSIRGSDEICLKPTYFPSRNLIRKPPKKIVITVVVINNYLFLASFQVMSLYNLIFLSSIPPLLLEVVAAVTTGSRSSVSFDILLRTFVNRFWSMDRISGQCHKTTRLSPSSTSPAI